MKALGIPSETLIQLADALEARHVRGPLTDFALRAFTRNREDVRDLEALRVKVGGELALASVCRLIAAERSASEARAAKVELVWTGPERIGASSRDTKVVVAELFAKAQQSVLVASYSLYSGGALFAPLAERMEAHPNLRVRMFFDITVGDGDAAPRTREGCEKRFAQRFLASQWRGSRLPEVYYDPRSIDDRTVHLHAKCVVVDGQYALVTSANTSAAAQQNNIEAGVLVDDRGLASALVKQFDDLVHAGLLVCVRGLGR